jgi:hypothetical protein
MKTNIKKKLRFICFIIAIAMMKQTANSQPYLDLFNSRYSYSPNTGSGSETNVPVKMQYFNFSANLPIRFKKSGDAILINPFVETWMIHWPGKEYEDRCLRGYALPIGYLKNFNHSRFSLLGMVIPRINMEKYSDVGHLDFFQFGGFLLGSFKVNDKLVLKAGGYYNKEFFGPLFIPLLGVDWKISDKENLFGTLPNQLVYERKLNSKLYAGAITRFITNSYGMIYKDEYLRIDENQLGVFADFYPAKKLVINLEFGHSILRKLREGLRSDVGTSSINLDPKDNFYMKLSLAYRIRFR